MNDQPPRLSPQDSAHLERARHLARRGWGHVHPNPMVGCVLVVADAVVGEGHHAAFGGPHAEIVALEAAHGATEGATAYVSLEPCNHQGKTPPCVRGLIDAGIRRVVYGAPDPGVDSGGGADALRAAGVEVLGPVWSSDAARAENPAFFHRAYHRTPFVALKLAMSMDARIAAMPGRRTRLTGPEAEREVHRLRKGFDAILIGAATARADDPRLTVRLVPPGRVAPGRLILAPNADVATDAALFSDVSSAPVHIFCALDAPAQAIEGLENAGARVHPVPDAGTPGRLSVDAILETCLEIGIYSILCEGGGALAGSLLAERHVHRLWLFIAPTTLGERGVPAFTPDAERLDWSDFRQAVGPQRFGQDTLIVLDRQED